jgi:signal transduction histidine kinase
VIFVFAIFALWVLVWLHRRFERERSDTIARIQQQFTPGVLRMPDELERPRFEDLQRIYETQVRPSAYVRRIIVTKIGMRDGRRHEATVWPVAYWLDHPNWREEAESLERRGLWDRGTEYGAIYLEYDNSRLNSVRGAIAALGFLLVMVLALVGRRLWVQGAQLSRTTVELEEKNRELVELERMSLAGQLSASIFHDIRKPLLNIRMDIEELEAAAEHSEPARERLGDIRRQVELFFSILRELNIERFIRGDQPEREFVNVNELLDRSCALVKYERRGVEVRTEYAPALPPILVFPYRLILVFSNIILNAYQAMSGRGRLALSTHLEGAAIRVRIADTGPGIEPENLARVFEPFFSTKQREGGSGLGLYISKTIVEDLGGAIVATSTPGEGTIFEITLPITAQPAVEEHRDVVETVEPLQTN